MMTGYNKTRTHRSLTDHTLYWKLQVKHTAQLTAVLELINDYFSRTHNSLLFTSNNKIFLIRKITIIPTVTHAYIWRHACTYICQLANQVAIAANKYVVVHVLTE